MKGKAGLRCSSSCPTPGNSAVTPVNGHASPPICTPAPAGTIGPIPLLRTVPAGAVDGATRPLTLTYLGRLPKISGHEVHWLARWRLAKRAREVFGVLPPALCPRSRAMVQIIRVLGPRQKPMDDDSIAALMVGIRDALKPSYIVDDSPKWATFLYRNDGTRREIGPRIEVVITYMDDLKEER